MSSLYIHIPFCKTKCAYCDFVSYTGCERLFAPYIDAVIAEAQKYKGQCVDTVFAGGGTPSILPDKLLAKLFAAVFTCFEVAKNAEITLEMNPNTVTAKNVRFYRKLGVNRVSLGLQAAQPELLKLLGRTHSCEDFERAVDYLIFAGFVNINADMIYGIPTQTIAQAVNTAELLCTLPLKHISAYSLTLSKPLLSGGIPLKEVCDDLDIEMSHAVADVLESSGFSRYEISNYAKRGYKCRHNLNYWMCGNYTALGAGAHGFDGNIRRENEPDVSKYISLIANTGDACIGQNPGADKFERLMLALRTSDGVPISIFSSDKKNRRELKTELEKLEGAGFIRRKPGKIVPTRFGMDIEHSLVLELEKFL